MRVIEKKRRRTWRSLMDCACAPFDWSAEVIQSFNGLFIAIIYIVTIISLLKGNPIDDMTWGTVALMIVYIISPLDEPILLPIYFYFLMYRVILGAVPATLVCFTLSIVIAFGYAIIHYIVGRYQMSTLEKALGILMITCLLAYMLNTVLVSSIIHYGEMRVEDGKLISYEKIRQAHYLTVEIDNMEYDQEFHSTKEAYDKCLEDGYILVNVYSNWGVECCRLQEKTGVFHGFL